MFRYTDDPVADAAAYDAELARLESQVPECGYCGKPVAEDYYYEINEYTVKHAGYNHLPLEKKLDALAKITGFDQVSVCEDVTEHYEYFREAVNCNKDDCCNLRK